VSAVLVPLLAGFARQLGGKSRDHDLCANPADGAHLLRNAAAVAGAKRLATELGSGYEAHALMAGGGPKDLSDWPDHILDQPPLAEGERCRNYARLLSAISGGGRAKGPEVIAVVTAPASIAAALPGAELANREELSDVIADVLVSHVVSLIESGIHTVALCEYDSGVSFISDASTRAEFRAPVIKAGALRGQTVIHFDAHAVATLDAATLDAGHASLPEHATRSDGIGDPLFVAIPPDIEPSQLRAALAGNDNV
jgi:hypothetical protein